MYERVLVPTDGSAGVQETLDHGLDLAERHDATVHTLYVVDRRQYIGAEDSVQADRRATLEAEGQTAVATVEERATERGLDVVSAVREGIPSKDILSYVDEQDVDVVVMGTHGRTGRDRLSHLGSVTERVVEDADVPVLVVNIDDE